MVRMVKAGPARRTPRSRGAMPKTWPAMPSRSMASLSVLVEWCLNSSINSSKFDCLLLLGRRSGPPPPDPGRGPGGAGLGPAPASGPGSGLLDGAVPDGRELAGREGGQDLLVLPVDLGDVGGLGPLVVGRVHDEVTAREVRTLLGLQVGQRLDQLLGVRFAGEVGLEHGLLERRHGGVGLVAEVPRHRLVEAAQGADDVGILLGQLLAEGVVVGLVVLVGG